MKKSLAHPQRRWRALPKADLDAELSRRGKPIALTEDERKASAMRKRNKALLGRTAAAKKNKKSE
jgi:hypothetical protein